MASPSTAPASTPSPRRVELLDLAYQYALQHGLGDLSLRPMAAALGSSPRVLLYLFGSKDGLIRALLARARAAELELLARIDGPELTGAGALRGAATELWGWLSAADHRGLLNLWLEGYARSLLEPHGPWEGFALATVEDWLRLLAGMQPAARRDSPAGLEQRTAVLAVLRGGLLDLLATGDEARVSAAVLGQLDTVAGDQ
jgi:AcrR family transcriptional regulator